MFPFASNPSTQVVAVKPRQEMSNGAQANKYVLPYKANQMLKLSWEQEQIDSAQRELVRMKRANKRVPIFDRSKMPKTLGQMAAVRQAVESTRFNSFSQLIQAEMQKAGL